ncbi:MAG: Wadjet anti-phage system protein JetD domain-containing protein [Acidimicrobiales bacterium]
MKTITDVQRLVSERIEKYWAESLLADAQSQDDPRWPWAVTLTSLNGQALNERWSEVWRWIVDWNTWADANHGSLTTANRHVGGVTRAIPTHISIPDIDAAAEATDSDWPRRLADARCRARILHEEFPTTLTSGLLRNVCALSDVDFDLVRTAARWFRRHDAAGLTARQVPIAGLHAKWLDRNTRLVTGLSGRPELGLVKRPSRIQFSYLDRHWLQHGNRRRDSISIDEPDHPPGYQPQVILVTENKDTALFFPQVEGGIVIEGNGNAVTRLAKIPWIRACPIIVYWGDLDAHGLAILDLLRSTGIPAEAMLMDEATLHRYAPYASPTYADGSPLPQASPPPTPFLSDDERRLLERITAPEWTGPRRIEQERIPLQTAHEELMLSLSHRPQAGSDRRSARLPQV